MTTEFPTIAEFETLCQMLQNDPEYSWHFQWSQGLERVTDPIVIARELIFVICNSGMHRKVARAIFNRVIDALEAGNSTATVFKHKGKVSAIDDIWARKEELPRQIAGLDDIDLLEWCGRLPWIGEITKYHAAKNLGADVAKPDRHLVRLAEKSGETVNELCSRLSKACSLRIATVDLVLWWAAAEGHIDTQPGDASAAEL